MFYRKEKKRKEKKRRKRRENKKKTNNPRLLVAGALDQDGPFKASNSSKTKVEWSLLKALLVEIKTGKSNAEENSFDWRMDSCFMCNKIN